MTAALKAPFPYFGGKSSVASIVWERFGDVDNYVEPFCGSLAVLLAAPRPARTETVNDADGLLVNAWRAIAFAPDETAEHAAWPVSELDLHARHIVLVERRHELTERLIGDPKYYDAELAGWWIWGACCWIGSGWCSGNGPWRREGRRLVNGTSGGGIAKRRPVLGQEKGVRRKAEGVQRQIPHFGNPGRGVNAPGIRTQIPHLSNAGQGIHASGLRSGPSPRKEALGAWFRALAARLESVRIICGDFRRVLTPAVTSALGTTAVFLDPPYDAERADNVYAHDDASVSAAARAWAIKHGREHRIALCGYEGEHEMPDDWEVVAWSASGGYARPDNDNRHRERIWFSPACLSSRQGRLF